ncbi:MAG: phosphodiester glycosidase family protein [Candidatus Izemoplasmataceae bacterium]
MKKLLILCLLLLQGTTVLATDYTYSFQLGTINHHETIYEDEDFMYHYFDVTATNGNLQKIFHATINPLSLNYELVLHDVYPAYGEYASGTVLEIAQDFEEKTGRKVYAAVNGDFFWNHQPIDSYVKNNHVWHQGHRLDKVSFGFNNLSEAVIGRMQAEAAILVSDTSFKVNKHDGQIPYKGEISVFRPGQVMNTVETSKYLIKATSETIANQYALPLEGHMVFEEGQPLFQTEVITVPEGYFGIAINGMAGDTDKNEAFYDVLEPDLFIQVLNQPINDFYGMQWVIGGNNILVENGIVMPYELKTSSSGQYWAPRTTIGLLENGHFFITVIDGRNTQHSVGITVPQQAQLAADLGATLALELDGGGSSTFILRINDTLTLVNQPSDGTMRKVTNAVLIVEREEIIDDEPTHPIDPVDEPAVDPVNHSRPVIFFTVLTFSLLGLLVLTHFIIMKRKA